MPKEDQQPENRQHLKTKNLSISGRRTSMRLEPVMWEALADICTREKKKLAEICELIDQHRGDLNLTSTLRLFMVCYFRSISKVGSPFLESLPNFIDKAVQGQTDLLEKKPKMRYNHSQKRKRLRGKTKDAETSMG